MEEWKIGVFGDKSVGKSAFVTRLCSDTFTTSYDPSITDSYRKLLEVDDQTVALDILEISSRMLEETWDRTMVSQCIHHGDAFVIVYDLSSFDSYRFVSERLRHIYRVHNQEVPVVIFGNKVDLGEEKRVVSKNDGEEYAIDHKALFMEGSAKTGENVEEAMKALLRKTKKLGKREENARTKAQNQQNNQPPPPPMYIRDVDEDPRGMTVKPAK